MAPRWLADGGDDAALLFARESSLTTSQLGFLQTRFPFCLFLLFVAGGDGEDRMRRRRAVVGRRDSGEGLDDR